MLCCPQMCWLLCVVVFGCWSLVLVVGIGIGVGVGVGVGVWCLVFVGGGWWVVGVGVGIGVETHDDSITTTIPVLLGRF